MRCLAAALSLVIVSAGGAAFAQQMPDDFQKLSDEFDKARSEWQEKQTAARIAGADETALQAMRAEDPMLTFMPRFQAGAKRHAGSDQAFPYLRWVFRMGSILRVASARDALDQIIRDHLEYPSMDGFAFIIALGAERHGFDRAKALEAQRKIAEATDDSTIRAEMLFWRSYVVATTGSTEGERNEAIRDLAAAIEIGDPATQPRAEKLQFELQRLQIGMVAPDIEGTDLDGVAFKLSDYRGKVVVLDFWGDW